MSPRWMNLWAQLRAWTRRTALPRHLQHGQLGERAARDYLCASGMKFLTANFRSKRGEIDLVLRDADCLVFVEVKSRSSETWNRPAAAIDAKRRRRLSQTAFDYLRLLGNPEIKFRFDVIEVLLANGLIREVRHLPNCFPLEAPRRYG